MRGGQRRWASLEGEGRPTPVRATATHPPHLNICPVTPLIMRLCNPLLILLPGQISTSLFVVCHIRALLQIVGFQVYQALLWAVDRSLGTQE